MHEHADGQEHVVFSPILHRPLPPHEVVAAREHAEGQEHVVRPVQERRVAVANKAIELDLRGAEQAGAQPQMLERGTPPTSWPVPDALSSLYSTRRAP